MVIEAIADLPFRERPLIELLDLASDRAVPNDDYAGYGWARARRVWLVEPGAERRAVDDALVLALHCPDDGERLADDVELYFELPEESPVTVLASKFFERWLPRLPHDASAIVLALCNRHHALLPRPAETSLPLYFACGEVESWMACADRDGRDDRIELRAPSWRKVPA
jgi:hypothetical protein